jgi:formylglycine-generating enzyme required for sulfatase activity
MGESKSALIIANYQYDHPGLRQLVAPARDAESLARVLADPGIGGFEVRTLINEPSHKVTLEIESFCENRKRDDLLLLYFSGHGVKDADGQLYFATVDTQLIQHNVRRATAVGARFINEVMSSSRSRRQILVLDCCYSGAFKQGMLVKGDKLVGAGEQLEGQGRVVLTASDALQYSFEGETVQGEGVRSVFTNMLAHGLETGEADLDRDGSYSLDEVYEYLHARVSDKQPQQKPMKMGYVEGKIFIGINPRPRAAELPPELQSSLEDPRPWVRQGAARELEKMLLGKHTGWALAAQAALASLATTDYDLRVRGAAEKSLAAYAEAERLKREEEVARPKAEAERATQEDVERQRLEREKAEAEGAASEKAEAERAAKENEKQEARVKADKKRLAQEKAEQERVAREKADAERREKEKAAAAQAAREKAQLERVAGKKAQAKRRKREKAVAERAARKKAQQELRAGEKTAAETRRSSLSRQGPVVGTVRENPKDGLKYVWIPPGTFIMGCSPSDTECERDEKPPHLVTITKGYWLGQTEVTVGAYKRFAAATGTAMPPHPDFNPGWSNKQMLMVNVSWDDAQAYCTWTGGRLPTEAEWEYAARAESTEARYGSLADVAWYNETSRWHAHPVGEKRANGFGLYDMLGNVWEWVNDWYDANYYKNSASQDPAGPVMGVYGVLRGGSWSSDPKYVRVSNRNRSNPGSSHVNVGFRCGGEVAGR